MRLSEGKNKMNYRFFFLKTFSLKKSLGHSNFLENLYVIRLKYIHI